MKVADSESGPPGRYRKILTLGAGGMGIVYLAEDTRLQRRVAVKQLRSGAASNAARSRIRSEAQLLASVSHPNIVRLYDVFEQDDSLALVMEYVEGPTLKRWMCERNPNLVQKLELLIQVCRGVDAAHALGIVHRDLKPDNILIASDGTAKIADFGIAKSLHHDGDKLTREGHVAGSIGTMSPEQLLGTGLDARSDLFSLGALAYWLLCGKNPFGDGQSPFKTAERIAHKPHPPASRFTPELPKDLCRLLDSLLAKSPSRRPRDAAAVCAQLEAIVRSAKGNAAAPPEVAPLTATVEIPAPAKTRPRRGRQLGIWAGTVLLLATAALVLLPQWLQNTERTYIAILVPTGTSALSGENREMLQSAVSAIRRGLANRRNLYLVPYTESKKLRDRTPAVQARAMSAQLLLKPIFNCASQTCELTLELIDTGKESVIARRSLSLETRSVVDSFQRTLQELNYLLPQFPARREDPSLSIGEEEHRRFLELEAHSYNYRTAEVTADTLGALEELQQKAPRFPPIYSLYSQLAVDNRLINRDANSDKKLEQFLARAPADIADTYEVLLAKYYLANMRSEWKESRELLSRLKTTIPDLAGYYMMESIYYLLRDKYDPALAAIDKALALRASTAYLKQKAIILGYAGDIPAATTYLRRVLEVDGNNLSAITRLATYELDAGDIDEAIRLYRSADAERLTAIDTFNLCSAYFLNRAFPAADKCFADLYTSLPHDLEPLLYRAEIARELGQPARAREFAERVRDLARDQQGWENQLMLALAYAQLQQPEKAVSPLLEIRQQAPDDTYSNHAFARVYIATDDAISTETYIRKSLDQGMSPVWYRTRHFAKLCRAPAFVGLRIDYPALCTDMLPGQVGQK